MPLQLPFTVTTHISKHVKGVRSQIFLVPSTWCQERDSVHLQTEKSSRRVKKEKKAKGGMGTRVAARPETHISQGFEKFF